MAHRVFNIALFIIYIVLMTGVMIWQGIGIAPDRFAFLLFFASFFVKRTRSFILDWSPFLFILISYDFLRGFADNIGGRVHFVELIEAEKAIFGMIPTEKLQSLFFKYPNPTIIDFLATIVYFLHFALPLGFGFTLWLYNRAYFKQFVTAILLLSYGAWVTFLLYPAAPPWISSNKGYLTGVNKILDITLASFPEKLKLPTIYHQFNPNEVAAMPSLHAAYPLLIFLFALKFFRFKSIPFLIYVLAVWISLVYLGEHYVIDIIAGGIYALVFYFVSVKIYCGHCRRVLKDRFFAGNQGPAE